MKKKYIVKSTRDFEKIIKTGKTERNKSFIIYYIDNELDYDRFGISVGKKIGKAVLRNKYKRKIRSIIDNYKKSYVNNKDYIIILRKEGINKKYNFLDEELNKLLNRKEKQDEK